MPLAIGFVTSKFDVSQEDENTINPIRGQSLLLWLKEKVAGRLELAEPDMEDWGWYSDVDWNGRAYLLGAVAMEEDDSPELYWIFQLDKQRTFWEVLLGREKITRDDECLRYFKAILESEPDFKNVEDVD